MENNLLKHKLKNFTGGEKKKLVLNLNLEMSFHTFLNLKVWLSTNNLPIIRGNDYGIWRRIYAIPFLRRFTDDEKDKTLPQKIKRRNT